VIPRDSVGETPIVRWVKPRSNGGRYPESDVPENQMSDRLFTDGRTIRHPEPHADVGWPTLAGG